MIKYAICNETFQGWDWASTCHKVAEIGYNGIEIAPFTLTDDVRDLSSHARKVISNTAKRSGLEITGLHWLLVSPRGLSVTSDDESVRKETSNYLLALVEFCGDIEGKNLVLGSPAQRRLPDCNAEKSADLLAEERLYQCLIPALDAAEKRGVVICLEPLPAPEADFILTLAEAESLILKWNHPSLRTIFDVKSASSETESFSILIEKYFQLIAHIHANDANRRGPGFGSTDYNPIFESLSKLNYDGYISVEVFDYLPDPVTIARESLNYLKRTEANHQS